MRRNPLVSGYLEGISRSMLERPEYQQLIRELANKRHGVYALYRGERLYYVGLAKNLRNRLKQHLKDRHGATWDRFSVYLTIADGHIKELESLILRIASPQGNSQSGRFARSTNLKIALGKAMRDHHRREEADLLGKPRREPRRSRTAKSRVARRDESELVLPPLAGLLSRGRLRGRVKGKTVTANVRSSGRIRFKGVLFDSPSAAAAAARGQPTNGWWFWMYQRSPGEWVRLKELRA